MASDNILVSNKGLHPTINFRFMLRVWGIFDVPCKSIRAFTKPNEYEFIQEGGLNDYVHIRRKPISQPFKLVVERYAGTDYIDPLPNGAELVLPVLLFIWNDRGSLASMFMFSGCVVMEKEYGELSAERAGLFTENITIGYTSLTPINIPDGLNDMGGKEPWDFSVDGNKTKWANTRNVFHGNEWSETTLAAKWEYDEAHPTATLRAKTYHATGLGVNKNVAKWEYDEKDPTKNTRANSADIYHKAGWAATDHAAKWEYDPTLPTRVLRAMAYRARGHGINPNIAKWEYDPTDPTKTKRAMSIDVYHGSGWQETNHAAKWEYQAGAVPQKNVRALSREIYHGSGWQQAENAAKWDPANGTKNERAMSTGMFDYTAVEADAKLKEKWEYQSGVTPPKNVRALTREVYHGGGWSAAENAAKWDSKTGTKNERAMSTGMFDYTAKTNDAKLKAKWEYKSGKTPPENARALTRKVDYGKKGGKAKSSIQAPLDHGNNNAVKNPRAQKRQIFHGNGWQATSFQGVWKYDKGNPSKGYRGMSAAFLNGGN